MKILKFSASNVMRLVAVTIEPKGNAVVLSGVNRSGKTSCLRAIMSVLSGSKDRPDKLLREGADKGEISLTIGNTEPELIATLKVTPQGETLTVRAASGAKYDSPQSVLDALRGAVGFEPMQFISLGADADGRKKQAAILQKLVGLNFTEIDAKKQALYDERTAVNREVKQAETVYGTMPHHDIPQTEEVSVADLTEQLQAALATNARNADFHKAVDTLASKGKNLTEEIVGHKEELKAMLDAIESKRARIAEREAELADLRTKYAAEAKALKDLADINVDPINGQIATCEATNRKVRANAQHKAWSLQMEEKRDESARLTKEIEAIDKLKADQLKAAKMPVPGLGFNSEGVTLNNLPLESASGAETLIVALGIGAAMSPKLKVLLFRDASLLDGDSRKIVEDFCEKNDMQCWLECVESSDPAAVQIVDGSTKEAA